MPAAYLEQKRVKTVSHHPEMAINIEHLGFVVLGTTGVHLGDGAQGGTPLHHASRLPGNNQTVAALITMCPQALLMVRQTLFTLYFIQ